MNDIDLRLPRRDVGRLLSLASERRRKAEKGLRKFEGNFDPKLGANMQETAEAYAALEKVLKEAMER